MGVVKSQESEQKSEFSPEQAVYPQICAGKM
jgi:hypothetical protein